MGVPQREVTRTFYTKLVGCTFNNEGSNTESRQTIISDLYRRGMLGFGQELKLVPEPHNRFDNHAVAVFGPDGRQLGYLGKNFAYEVFTSIKSGKHCIAYVERVNGGSGYSYGISMKIEEYVDIVQKPVVPPKPQYNELQARLDYEIAKAEYDDQSLTPDAFANLEKAATYGLADAQFLFACCYDFGICTHKDERVAAVWYEKSAQNGNQHAQCNLAMDYYSGTGVPQNFNKAVYWARKSVDQGDDNGMVILGRMYERGEGVEQNLVKSFALYLRSAELGNIDGASNTGICYLIGRGVTRNPFEATKWNRKAAEAGHPSAQFNLANQYFQGDGVPMDRETGTEWYIRAAQSGHPQASRLLRQIGLI